MKLFFSYCKSYSILICCSLCSVLKAQTKDSITHQLPEVTIHESKLQQFQPSKKTTILDSSILSHYQTTSVAEVLSSNSSIHIKSYGNGNISTSSIRGGNASQTAVLWNGLNIQNPMLGQTDLSLLPTLFFERVTLEYGGGAALNGSGAMGGSIILQNKALFNQGFTSKIQTSVGSFDTKKIAALTQLSFKKINSTTRIYYTQSQNNYPYKDTLDKEHPLKNVIHADYISKGILQEIALAPNLYHTFNVRMWYNYLHRRLPSYTTILSSQQQLDENLKINADWTFEKNNWQTNARFGFFKDILNYNDSLTQIDSKSSTNAIIGEADATYQLKQHRFNIGINATSYQSNFSTYGMHREQNKLAFFAAYKLKFLKQKMHAHASFRKEITNQTYVPITGNTGFLFHAHPLFTLKLNGNKSFRLPTLNDLYWQPGGNPNLKPEEAYEFDGGITFNYQKKTVSILIEGTYFNRHTSNWIIWLPNSSSIWSPQNIAQVYSRGTETKTELLFKKKKTLAKLTINTAYTLATNQFSKAENDNSVGKQLFYTPRYTGQMGLLLGTKNFSLLYTQNYTGYRFTTSDNSSWLNPYFMSNLRMSYSYSYTKSTFECFFALNNLFNANYQIVSNRPMPLRNFEIGLSIKYHHKKESN